MMAMTLRAPRTSWPVPQPSWPGLTRISAPNGAVCRLGADGRVKPGQDGWGGAGQDGWGGADQDGWGGADQDDWGGTGHDTRGARSVRR